MFGWEFPPHITGGLGTACYGMTKGLLKQGAKVLFAVPKAYGDEDERAVRLINASDVEVHFRKSEIKELVKNLTYIEVNSNLAPYLDPEQYEKVIRETKKEREERKKSIYSQRFDFSGKYGPDLLEEVARFALVAGEIASRYDFDLIHAHDWHTYYAGLAAKAVSGKPLIMHIHATEFDRTGENVNSQIYEIEKAGFEGADKIIAVSNLTRNTVINRYGIAPEKVVTIHNAIEPVEKMEMLSIKKNVSEKIVTFLGRITFQKGPEYFVEAARLVLSKDRNVRFVMAGSGDMMYKIVRQVARLKMSDRFHFTGFLKGDDVDRMFAMSDVFVMPSVSEPFGLVPLEAMRINVPVIVSKQSGVAEVLRHAIKVDFWDTHGMADAIHGLLHYSALSDMFIKYGREEVDNLKWENAAVKIMKEYKDTVSNVK
ncbi:MAG: glycosyltransferase family 4 protein [Bacteroidales bacterium]|nr:glycosyltransferase family 4 protein [Bacteroidales bacterium]